MSSTLKYKRIFSSNSGTGSGSGTSLNGFTASGTNTYTATPSPALASYVTNTSVIIKFTNANTGAATINLNGLGAKSIVKGVSTALIAGDIQAGSEFLLIYDGTNYVISESSYVETELALKAPLASPTFTGNASFNSNVTFTPVVNSSLSGANQRIPSHATAYVIFTNVGLTSIGSANNGGVSGGHTLCISNETGASIIIVNNYGSAAAGEAIYTGKESDVVIPNHGTFWLQYNSTSSAWVSICSGLTNSQSLISASGIDWNYTHLYKTLSANTTFTFANAADAKIIIVALTNTASNYTVAWPSVVWAGGSAPVQTVGAKTDMYTFTQINGTIYGSVVQNMS